MAQIEIKGISKIYEIEGSKFKAVDGVSLEVEKGEFLSIIGHSGSGKTTLLSIVGGILRPTSGRILFNGVDVYAQHDDALSAYRADRVGYIFQFASLLPVLSAQENLLLPVIFRTKSKASEEDMGRAVEYLEAMGLKDKMDARPAQLSGGQQRRVAIARSLMNAPDIILADEPTGDLDEETEAEVMKFLRGKCRERGITFILVTHNSELAKEADRRLVMSRGVISG